MTQNQADQLGNVIGALVGVGLLVGAIASAPVAAPLAGIALAEVAALSFAFGFATSIYSGHVLGNLFGNPTNCFPAGTPITLIDGSTKPIEEIRKSDLVAAFDEFGELLGRRVVRLFRNVTNQATS